MAEPLRVSNPTPSSAPSTQPILTHEKSLTKKVAKGSEAGDIYDQQVLMLGTQLVTQISILLKMSRLHGRTNAALDNPVDSALTVIKTLAHDEPISIRLQNDFLFFGQRHLKVTAAQMPVFSTVIDTLNHWNIGGDFFLERNGIAGLFGNLSSSLQASMRQPAPSQRCKPHLNRIP